MDSIKAARKVELLPHDGNWKTLFDQEEIRLKKILSDNLMGCYHIGSTAINNIYAKPIIDILCVVKSMTILDKMDEAFIKHAYTPMGELGIAGRRFYIKSKEKRTHHLHIFQEGNSEIKRHVAFRDFLNQHQEYARGYSLIKLKLAKIFPNDIEGYIKGKNAFIEYIDYQTGNAKKIQLQASDTISIQTYDLKWRQLANAEIEIIKSYCQSLDYYCIEHIGSTAVPDLASKSVIDIFIVLYNLNEGSKWVKDLAHLGYVFWEDNPDKSHLRLFKGMPPFGSGRTHHLHIVTKDNTTWEHRVAFRDILRKDKLKMKAYQKLKHQLAKQYKHDREQYTEKKGEFIKAVLAANGYDKPVNR